jgi:hypothetical protein
LRAKPRELPQCNCDAALPVGVSARTALSLLMNLGSTFCTFNKVTAVPIVELLAYAIIGLAIFLTVGGAIFLAGINAYERVEDWRASRLARRGGRPR